MDTLWTDFVNSEWHDWRGSGRSENRLVLTAWQDAFLDKWKLEAPVPAMGQEIDEMQTFRRHLHRLAAELAAGGSISQTDREWLNTMMAPGLVRRHLDGDEQAMRLFLSPVGNDWRQVMAEVAADFAKTLLEGESLRIRICENADCKWVFYDDTRNRTKRYCDDKMCGNLMKVRRFRARKKAEMKKET
ncbi:CGNR zinc finger domain-containing protein [Paenibacillus sedimenti]|uniref:CGNR zinc finger domain-containing protein n=1 Tax=Paenibacillus sedimenti TaxID=2770274 RepID=A0A926QL29_9BACL|nr:CGNR zinc finger domain-containing protein [Paenibacillus sedimenti]MBD0382423.1 CGNR zinc finger domain-containing protein [Paenibacillus sedimenti]